MRRVIVVISVERRRAAGRELCAESTIQRLVVLAITHVHGLAGRREELRALMRATEDLVAGEPGCRLYRFTATLDDPDEYVHLQEWADEESWRAHQSSPAFRDYQRGLFDLLARPSDMQVRRGGETVNPAPSAPPDPRALG
jgi:quinol monooxygenase YgiN